MGAPKMKSVFIAKLVATKVESAAEAGAISPDNNQKIILKEAFSSEDKMNKFIATSEKIVSALNEHMSNVNFAFETDSIDVG